MSMYPSFKAITPIQPDYWRFTVDGLRLLCNEVSEVDAGPSIGPTCGVVWVVREWFNSWTSDRVLSNLLLIPVASLTAPLRYID